MVQRHDLIKSSIDSLLLSLISEHPIYGYLIIKELEGRSQGYFKFKRAPCTRLFTGWKNLAW